MAANKRIIKVLLGYIVCALLAFLLYLYPADKYTFWPKCIFNYYTGYYCPGCGNTRALSALLHGHLGESLKKNIILIPAIIVVLLLLAYPKLAFNRVFAWSISVVVILFFILRNIPYYPFSLLAPH